VSDVISVAGSQAYFVETRCKELSESEIISQIEKCKSIELNVEAKVAIINDIENGSKQFVVCSTLNLVKQSVNTSWRNHESQL